MKNPLLPAEIQNELLKGRVPQNQGERDFMDFYGWESCPKASRPKKKLKCKYCLREWEATGWPAPRRMIEQYILNFPMAISPQFIFLFPTVCSEECQELATYGNREKKSKPFSEEPDPF